MYWFSQDEFAGSNILCEYCRLFYYWLYIYFFVEKFQVHPALKFALTVGFCGGLTTFSTFSLELFEMIQNSYFLQAFLYVLFSVIIGIIAVYLGGYFAKFL